MRSMVAVMGRPLDPLGGSRPSLFIPEKIWALMAMPGLSLPTMQKTLLSLKSGSITADKTNTYTNFLAAMFESMLFKRHF
jgi:hypothetical protein